jgi:hypothetical protein
MAVLLDTGPWVALLSRAMTPITNGQWSNFGFSSLHC